MTNSLQSEALLTIIIITYNRLQLLQEAVSSCMRQTEKNFNLLIYDNGSSDGTEGFLTDLKSSEITIRIIRNDVNVFAMNMFKQFVPYISTPWATILTDDDMLKPDFVEKVSSYLSKMNNGILFMGFETIDNNGNVMSCMEPEPYELNTEDAVEALFSSQPPATAGIGGFVFLADVLKGQKEDFWDYPRLFFCDTRLVLEGVLTGGITVVPERLYQRRHWEGAESHSSVGQILAKFEAQTLFMKDCAQKLDKFSKRALCNYSKHFYSVKNFFNSNILPCLLQPGFSTRDAWRMIRLAHRLNKRLVPHCCMLLLAVAVNSKPLRDVGMRIRHSMR